MPTCLLLRILLAAALIEARMVAQTISVEVNVSGQTNLWLSGTPAGTHAGACIDRVGDRAPGQSPVELLGLPLQQGVQLFFAASGQVNNGPLGSAPTAPPDGLEAYIIGNSNGAENGIANITAPIDALLGVFLGEDEPGGGALPSSLDFGSRESRDYRTLSPQLQQPFFIGDGVDSAGGLQLVIVPNAATRLFLGTMDGCGHWNNEGVFHVRVTATNSLIMTPFLNAGGVISLEAEDAALLPPMASFRTNSAFSSALHRILKGRSWRSAVPCLSARQRGISHLGSCSGGDVGQRLVLCFGG